MEKEIKELIRKNENYLYRYINQRDELRNKVHFCSKHKFEEEVRIAQIHISAVDGIIYDFQQMIKDLKIIVKSFEKDGSKETE
jgi:hypothetical protein